jgi:hypothetical protein|tara:strand:- start:198 stop:1445 length:1248 start_codon:yes stop_codon:yes gene_type:complete
MAYGDADIASPSLEGFDRRATGDPPSSSATSISTTRRPIIPSRDASRADVPSVFLELMVKIRKERHELTKDERGALKRCEEQMQSRAVVAGYVTGAGTNTVLQFFPAFKTQRIGRYLAAASFGVTGAFYGARSAARACLERLVTLDDSKLGEYAADIVRKNAPNDPMLAKAPSPASAGGFDTVTARAVTGDTNIDDAGGSFRERVLREGRRQEAERGVQTGRERRDAARREDLGRPAADVRRTADIRADAEAEARRRVREREREHTSVGEHRSVVDLSDEPSVAASEGRESSRAGTSSMDASAGFDRVFRDPLAAAGMRRGDAWGTVDDDAHGSDDKRQSSSELRNERRMEWTRRRKERIRRGVDALSPFEGEEARATPDMFDASEFAARREGERTRKARPRATVRTEYGDVMDR